MENNILFPLVVVFGVLLENFVFLVIAMSEPGSKFPAAAITTVAVQVLWAICTGPFFLMFLDYAHKKWNKWLNELLTEKNRYAG